MSTTGLDVFDKTLQSTNLWLDEIMADIGPDRRAAWKILSTVLHKLRDRLGPDLAAHLAAQLPLLVRGAYYDLYEPSKQPTDVDSADDFVADVARWLSDARPVDPEAAVAAVFRVLDRHLSTGLVEKVRKALPKSVRSLLPSPVSETSVRPGEPATGG